VLSPEAKEFVPRQPVDAVTHDPAVTSVSAGDALVVPGDGLLGAGPPDLLGLPGYVTSCYPFQAREHRWVCCVCCACWMSWTSAGSRRLLDIMLGVGVVRLLNMLDEVDICGPRGSGRLLDIMLGVVRLLTLTLFSDAPGHYHSASGHTDCKFLLVTHSWGIQILSFY